MNCRCHARPSMVARWLARFLHQMCLALRASGLWLRYATLQNLIPSFPWIAPPRPPSRRNPRKGRDQILPSGNLGDGRVKFFPLFGCKEFGRSFGSDAIWFFRLAWWRCGRERALLAGVASENHHGMFELCLGYRSDVSRRGLNCANSLQCCWYTVQVATSSNSEYGVKVSPKSYERRRLEDWGVQLCRKIWK